MDAAGWTALGTWVLVVGTLLAVYWQSRQQRLINAANMIMILHDRFESTLMKVYRRELSNTVLSGKPVQQKDDHLLVFFETLGLLTHRQVLDEEMVWNEFSWEAVRYYLALTRPIDHIQALREASHDRTLYDEFEWLFRTMIRLDSSKTVATPNQAEVKEFLTEEQSLTT